MKKAIKIEIEGTDGAGKSTALKYLIEKLQGMGQKVLETREVGSPLIPINVKLRELVLSPDSNLGGDSMELIFAAMRLENDKHYKSVSDQYDLIVSDRGWLSHLAYTDHNVNKEFTKELYLDFLQKRTDMPDIVVYLSVDTETALQRRIKRGSGMDVIEMKGVSFQEKVRGSFLHYLESFGKLKPETTVLIVNANEDIYGVRDQLDTIANLIVDLKNK